jgi:hypothetical protein
MLYKNKVIGGCSEKVHTTNFKNKYVIIIKILYYFNLSKVFKNTFLFNKKEDFVKKLTLVAYEIVITFQWRPLY